MNEHVPTRVVIPYTPRSYLRPFHESQKIYRYMVFHRRSGKTVGIGNELIRNALRNERQYPPPRYAYVGPSFGQAKDTIWSYLKHYTARIPKVKVSESDLQIVLPNGALMNLYPGADAYERMRGLYFDMVAMDEFPLLNDDALDSVVYPCLADYDGRLVIAGTANGDDHFYEAKKNAEANPDEWDVFDVRVGYGDDHISGNVHVMYSGEEALKEPVVARLQRNMTPAKFAREMKNDFSASIEGAYYGDEIDLARKTNRVGLYPYDSRYYVVVWWDLGVADTMSLWFAQRIGGELRLIDYEEGRGKGVDHYLTICSKKPYVISKHVLPHDAAHRERSTGRSVIDLFDSLSVPYVMCPILPVSDRIDAVRRALPTCKFNELPCEKGLSALQSYQAGRNGKPIHNWASHPADSFGYGVLCLDLVKEWGGMFSRATGALRRGIKGIV